MKLLYVISPCYLNALRTEADNYNFYIQGYQNFKQANNGLYKRNISDILGFLYFADTIPRKPWELIKFIRRVDTFAPKGMIFLISVKDPTNLDVIKHNIKTINLTVKCSVKWELVTDVVVKTAFAPFILSNYDLYEDTNIGSIKKINTSIYNRNSEPNNIQYRRLFSNNLMEVLSEVNKLETCQETEQADLILNKLISTKSVARQVRLAFIRAHFGIEPVERELLKNLHVLTENEILDKALYSKFQEVVYENGKN